jgi:hypothetical protein
MTEHEPVVVVELAVDGGAQATLGGIGERHRRRSRGPGEHAPDGPGEHGGRTPHFAVPGIIPMG